MDARTARVPVIECLPVLLIMTLVAQPVPQSQIAVCFWKVVEMRGPFKSTKAFALRRNYYFRTVGGSHQ